MLPPAVTIRDTFLRHQQDTRVQQAMQVVMSREPGALVSLQKAIDIVERELQLTEEESLDQHKESCSDVMNLHHGKPARQQNTDIHHCLAVLSDMDKSLETMQETLTAMTEQTGPVAAQAASYEQDISFKTAVHAALTNFLCERTVTPELAQQLQTAPLDAKYLELLAEVEAKLSAALADDSLESVSSVVPQLLRLRSVVVLRVRQFLSAEITSAGESKASTQAKQTALIRDHRLFFAYLGCVHPRSAFEVRSLYVSTISAVYLKHFAAYVEALTRSLSSSKRFNILSVVSFAKPPHSSYLTDKVNSTPHFPSRGTTVDYVECFRSVHRCLCDTLTFEAAFLKHFFGCCDPGFTTAPAVQVSDSRRPELAYLETNPEALLKSITKPVLGLLIEHLDGRPLTDPQETFLFLRINQYHEDLMSVRGISGLESFHALVERRLVRSLRDSLRRQVSLVQASVEQIPADLISSQPYALVQRVACTLANLVLIAETPLPVNDAAFMLERTGPPRQAIDIVSHPCQALATSLDMLIEACTVKSNSTPAFLINNLDYCLQCFLWLEGGSVETAMTLLRRETSIKQHSILGPVTQQFEERLAAKVEEYITSILTTGSFSEHVADTIRSGYNASHAPRDPTTRTSPAPCLCLVSPSVEVSSVRGP